MKPPPQTYLHAFKRNWPALCLLTAISLLNGGMGIGTQNHAAQIPYVLKALDPTLYPHGSFGEAIQRYYSLFWKVMALAAHYIPLESCLIIAHAATRVILFAGIFSLGFSLFRNTRVALVGVCLAVFDLRTILVTFVTVTSSTPTHTVFAMALMAWMTLFLWEHRLMWCAAILGLICQANLMNGLLLCFVVAVTILCNLRSYLSWRLPAAVVLWFLISFTALAWAMSTKPPDLPPAEYIQVLKKCFWYHLFPFMWDMRVWVQLGGLLATVCLCLNIRGAFPRARLMYSTLLGIVAAWVIHALVSVIPFLQRLVLLQWGRTCALLVILMLPVLAYVITEWLPQRGPKVYVFCCAVLTAGWALAHGLQPAALMLFLCLWAPFRRAVQRIRGGTSKNLPNVCAVTAELLLLAFLVMGFVHNVRARGLTVQTQEQSWIEAQQWARMSTPKTALFLTPSDQMGFRVFSRRSIYFAWDDVGTILWAPHLAGKILQKQREIQQLGLFLKPYSNVSEQSLLLFCKEKGIDYLVLPAEVAMTLQPCFRNSKWAIYATGP